jgi:hypothetical protein
MKRPQQDYFSRFPFAELRSQDGRSHLKLCSYGYGYPEEKTGNDADWHRNYLILTLPGFRAEIDEVILDGRGLAVLLGELREFSRVQGGTIEFETLEPYLGLSFQFEPTKNVIVSGYVQYPVGHGPKLSFEFGTDLTYVDKFTEGIQEILKEFPPRNTVT